MNKETHKRERSDRKIILPYIGSVSGLTTRQLQPQGITVARKPSQTLGRLLSKRKERLKMDTKDKRRVHSQVDGLWRVPCRSNRERSSCWNVRAPTLATRRHDPLSLSVHKDQERLKFTLDNVETLNQATTLPAREFLEALYSSNNSINKRIEMGHVHIRMRGR